MKDEYIVMKVSDLRLLLNDIKRFKHYYIYASDQNRDGQGEWHCDIEVGDEPLGEDGWGDGEEHYSFDSLENHLAKFGQTSLSSVRPSASPRHEGLRLQERLELCEDMFDNFLREAQQLIDDMRGEEDE
jgi:hypothetical protein